MQNRKLDPDVQRRHNFRNNLHTILLVLASALILGLIAYSVFGVVGLIAAAIIAAVFMSSMSSVSPKMVLGLYKARPLAVHEAPELHQIIEDLAARAGLPNTPKLYYVPTKIMNAFAVGRKDDAAIAVTDGLQKAMTTRQIQAILAHETAHIVNGDLKVMGIADILNRTTSLMSTLGLVGVPVIFGLGMMAPLPGLLLMLAAPTIGGLLQLGLSRAREYDADLDGVTLTDDPEALASALRILEERQGATWGSVVLPGARMPQPSLLRSHPKTEDRIERLNALKHDGTEQIVRHSAPLKTSPSLVPSVSNPRVRWHRLGVYY